jgi:hypothetical protein
MGLKNALGHFQRMMTNTLRDLLWKICLAYQDDIQLGTATVLDAADRDSILMTLDAKSLRLKISKYHFRKMSVQILDFGVSCNSITPNDEHAQDMTNFPERGMDSICNSFSVCSRSSPVGR